MVRKPTYGELEQRVKELQMTEKRMNLILEGTNAGSWDWDVVNGDISLDDNSIRILGYEPGEMNIDSDWWDKSIHQDSKPALESALNAYLEGSEKYYELEYRIRTKSGEWKWVWSRGICTAYDNRGKPLSFIGTHRDVTDRKQTEEALKKVREELEEKVKKRTEDLMKSKERLEFSHHLLKIANKSSEAIPVLEDIVAEVLNLTGCEAVGIRILDSEGNIPYEAYVGFSRQFYESESPLSIRSDRCMCINVVKGDINPNQPFITDYGSFYMNGTTSFLATVSEEDKGETRNVCNQVGYESVALVPIKIGDLILGLIHIADSHDNMVPVEIVNVVEEAAMHLGTAIQRISVEESLRQRTHALRKRVKELDCLYSISHLIEEPGISLKGIIKGVVDLIAPSWQYPEITCARIILEDQECKTENFIETVWKQTSEIMLHDKRIGVLEVGYLEERPRADEGPFSKEERSLIDAIAERLRRIVEHTKAEEALRVSERKYRTLTENIPEIIYSFDKNGKIITINPQAEELFGHQREEIIGNHFSQFIHPQDKDMYLRILMEGVKNHQKYIRGLTFRVVDKTGAHRWVEMHSHNQFDAHGTFLQQDGILDDITETKLLQNQLIRTERLAATGQLAASIAHEINSPLQGIISLMGLMKESSDKDTELLENIELIEGGFKRIRDTVNNLLDLNRPDKEQKQPININVVISDTLSLVQAVLKKSKIKVDLNLSSSVPDILASPQQLGHIFLNLINNAVEAMTGKHEGEGWKERTGAGGEIKINTRLRDEKIIIEVADTGPGISRKDMEHIFDPFYTRKKTMGMGIGLSICHGIIEDHKGIIVATNLPAGGAVFKITLPVN